MWNVCTNWSAFCGKRVEFTFEFIINFVISLPHFPNLHTNQTSVISIVQLLMTSLSLCSGWLAGHLKSINYFNATTSSQYSSSSTPTTHDSLVACTWHSLPKSNSIQQYFQILGLVSFSLSFIKSTRILWPVLNDQHHSARQPGRALSFAHNNNLPRPTNNLTLAVINFSIVVVVAIVGKSIPNSIPLSLRSN